MHIQVRSVACRFDARRYDDQFSRSGNLSHSEANPHAASPAQTGNIASRMNSNPLATDVSAPHVHLYSKSVKWCLRKFSAAIQRLRKCMWAHTLESYPVFKMRTTDCVELNGNLLPSRAGQTKDHAISDASRKGYLHRDGWCREGGEGALPGFDTESPPQHQPPLSKFQTPLFSTQKLSLPNRCVWGFDDIAEDGNELHWMLA